ncbi:hypothetical protein [Vibrio navarrensis]|uniref:hypothetical protein n=1 Tax=Vibrio navarrensis TaxID=29495 RepID=UPI0018DE4618|nr:hypothetical protein [Vibrio navarrensis]EJB8414100.1 hypothetical protein [Vibrio vulnificus]MBH9741173.1 hypothetical protein [Vibrio navarrensis]
MKMNYHLEIYEPEDPSCVAGYFESSSPFMTISVGDKISSHSLNQTDELKAVRVTKVEHILWEVENSHVAHKVCIYTELL